MYTPDALKCFAYPTTTNVAIPTRLGEARRASFVGKTNFVSN
jgi:hypothetical protein